MLLCFFRDTEVLSHFEHSSASPPLAVARGNTPSPNALVAYPPCGVIPFHGFTMYGTSSLCERLDIFSCLFSSFSLDYIIYGLSFPSSLKIFILGLIYVISVVGFTMYSAITLIRLFLLRYIRVVHSLVHCARRAASVYNFGTVFRHTPSIRFSQVHGVRCIDSKI